jgi:RNA polymerase sigma-70 factor, ECF subfamily
VHADDVTLLQAFHRADADLAAGIMQRHNQTLWCIARGILRDDDEAEEVVQETWFLAVALEVLPDAIRTHLGLHGPDAGR